MHGLGYEKCIYTGFTLKGGINPGGNCPDGNYYDKLELSS